MARYGTRPEFQLEHHRANETSSVLATLGLWNYRTGFTIIRMRSSSY